MGTLISDIRFGVRMLIKDRWLTAAALLILTLGIGTTIVVLAIVNAVLIRPLPYRDVSRIVVIGETDPYGNADQTSWGNVAPADLAEWKSMSDVFEEIGAYHSFGDLNLTGAGDPELIAGTRVTAGLFPLLGVRPAIGRLFSEEEDRRDERVLILSDSLWRRRFGADPSVLGKSLTLSGRPFIVVGVMPPELKLVPSAEIWTPMGFGESEWKQRNYFLNVIGRLRADATLAQAQSQMDRIAEELQQKSPSNNKGRGVLLAQLSRHLVEEVRPALLILLTAVSLVLLLTCLNVGNLLMSHFAARDKEIAIRIALGADRFRISRQIVTQSLLLTLMGGLAGCLLAEAGIKVLTRIDPGYIPKFAEVTIDTPVLAFGLAISLLTGLVLGGFIAIRATPRLMESLKATAQYSSRSFGSVKSRTFLATTEVALAMVLLIATGLLVKSFIRLSQVDPGFNPTHLLTLQIKLSPATYKTGANTLEFQRALVQEASTIPGVKSIAVSSSLPFTNLALERSFTIDALQGGEGATQASAEFCSVSSNFFETMGVRLISGRYFSQWDTPDSAGVIIINESMAKRFFPGRDPVGSSFSMQKHNYEVVGVVGDIRNFGAFLKPKPQMYGPMSQLPLPRMCILIRTDGPPTSLVEPIRAAVGNIDGNQPIYDIHPMDERLFKSAAIPYFITVVFSTFGAIAVLLSAVGVYAVASYAIKRRTKEIGIRIALGASSSDVIRGVMKQSIVTVATGLAIGFSFSLAFTRFLASQLYGVSAIDIFVFVAVTAGISGIALTACFIPARRASKLDPILALKQE
jgi:putative ABC transport system permease protein